MKAKMERKSVINGLVCCDRLHNGGEVQCATSCPYYKKLDGSVDNNCRGRLIHDTLVMVKYHLKLLDDEDYIKNK